VAVPSDSIRLIPEWKVAAGGKPLELLDDAGLLKVVVELDVDLFGHCVLTFHDPELRLINGDRFECGTPVKVTAGFGHRQEVVFEGEVVALEPQFRRDRRALRVVCHESIHRLALRTRTRAFIGVDDKEIVTNIAREHGLSSDAPSGSKEHALQGNVSDAVFLRRIAQKHGNHLRIAGRKLVVGPPPKGKRLTIAPGDGLKNIRVRIQAQAQVDEVAVHGWDPKTKQELVGKAKGTGAVGEGSRRHGGGASIAFAGHEHPPADTATAQAMAEGRMRKLAEGFAVAHVDMIGNPDVVPGAEVTFERFGEKLDGTYRVETARHEFSKHGYFCSCKAVRLSIKAAAVAPLAPAQKPLRSPESRPVLAAQAEATPPLHLEGGSEATGPVHLGTDASDNPPPALQVREGP
jgi:phage protein D